MILRLPEEIETDRLTIRVAKPGDGAVFNKAIVSSLSDLETWLAWVTPAPTLEQSEDACRKAYGRFLLNEDLMAFFFLKETNELIGGSGLHDADWGKRHFEIGYWGNTKFGGQGLISEGVKALAGYALNELNAARVFLTTDEKNIKSWKLAERAGFEYEGTLRNDRFGIDGKLRNTKVYSKICSGSER